MGVGLLPLLERADLLGSNESKGVWGSRRIDAPSRLGK
jgi:hypothetical protein